LGWAEEWEAPYILSVRQLLPFGNQFPVTGSEIGCLW